MGTTPGIRLVGDGGKTAWGRIEGWPDGLVERLLGECLSETAGPDVSTSHWMSDGAFPCWGQRLAACVRRLPVLPTQPSGQGLWRAIPRLKALRNDWDSGKLAITLRDKPISRGHVIQP